MSTPRPIRFPELDAMRGLAAAAVVLFHLTLLLDIHVPAWWMATPMALLFEGRKVVLFFFVLSGFVLYLPYRSNRQASYPAFLAKRICRLYGPYLAALLAAIALDRSLAGHAPQVNEWFARTWQTPMPQRAVLDHLLFLGSYDTYQFNIVIWSLIVEMRVSLVFPWLAWAAGRLPRGWDFALTCIASIAACAVAHQRIAHVSVLVDQISLALLFLLGAVLAQHYPALLALLGRHTALWWTTLLAVCLLVSLTGLSETHMGSAAALEQTAIGLASAAAILLSMHPGRLRRALLTTHLQHLGRISFSLYLTHALVLWTLVTLLWRRADHLLIAGAILPISLLAAELFYRLVEEPSMRLGNRLSGYLRRT